MSEKDSKKETDNQKNQQNPPGQGKIIPVDISREMRDSYLDYAMSVIVARALPDVRDGMKPVQRRILYTMHEAGLGHSAKFRKSAFIVGDTMGKYHPHGDAPIYGTLARLAQNFSMRYPLIDGQGNWGSIDGDAPAAMRYTEARMTSLSEKMMDDIEKNTVDFTPNYDNRINEPKVLPSAVPQLLINGSLGIAVGMATSIPPHNLGEVVDATVRLIDNPNASLEELMQFVKGPDFPTGGLIFNIKDIQQAYATGRGGVLARGEAEISESKKGGFQILISSLPYQVNKSELIMKIADLVRDKKLEGIRDIRDESDRKEMVRIVIELKTGVNPQNILNNLYKHTDLEKAFHFNMIALVDGIQPQVLRLKDILGYFIKHREVVVERRARFDLNKALERAHILEGLKKAIDHIDAVIKTIKASKDKDDAHKKLMAQFKFSDKQATAILEMRLQNLANLERQNIEDELKEKQKLIKDLRALLADPKKILKVVKEEIIEVKNKYADERRTKVVARAAKIMSFDDLVPSKDQIMVLTEDGYIKRTDPEAYKAQKRGGIGVIDINTKEEDFVRALLTANTHDDLLFFSDKGKVYQIKMYDLPEGKRATKGKSIMNFLALMESEKITSVLVFPRAAKEEQKLAGGGSGFLIMATKNGVVKKVDASNFQDVRKSGIAAIRLEKGDELKFVHLVSKGDNVILVTKKGMAIMFKESNVRAMGRAAGGVRGIKLTNGDELVGADVTRDSKDHFVLTMSKKGFGKKTSVKNYRAQKRGGTGVKTSKVTEKTGPLMVAKVTGLELEEMIAISQKGQVIRTSLGQVPVLGRQTQGVKIMRMKPGDSIASLTCF